LRYMRRYLRVEEELEELEAVAIGEDVQAGEG
jgi:hypothetical protein